MSTEDYGHVCPGCHQRLAWNRMWRADNGLCGDCDRKHNEQQHPLDQRSYERGKRDGWNEAMAAMQNAGRSS